MMGKPRWCMGMLGTKRRQFGNIVGHVKGVADMSSLSEWTARQFDPSLSWADVEWVKQRWGGKLILKGILDVEDAKLAVASGADALIVSNHGGRQLDGASSSIEALPAHRRRRRLADRGAPRRRHPLGPGRAEGLGARRARHVHRPRVPLRPRRDGAGGRHARARRSSATSSTSRWRSAAARPSRASTAASSCRARSRPDRAVPRRAARAGDRHAAIRHQARLDDGHRDLPGRGDGAVVLRVGGRAVARRGVPSVRVRAGHADHGGAGGLRRRAA